MTFDHKITTLTIDYGADFRRSAFGPWLNLLTSDHGLNSRINISTAHFAKQAYRNIE